MTIVKQENVVVKINAKMNLKYFKYEEFASPDLPDSGSLMDPTFVGMLDNARESSSVPFKINSAYRSEKHNQRIGGKKNSSHLVGKAADISCTDSRSRWIIISALQKAGFNRFGIAKTFIHVDSDEDKAANVIWTY
jgi:zinc D-Ala-D-Ala carboxypeptidase